MNEKSISLYDYHERHYNNIHFVYFWGISLCAVVFSSIFLFNGSIYWTGVLALGLSLGAGIATFAWLHSSSSQVIFRNNDVTIYRKSGLKKLVKIEDIEDVSIRENQTRVAQTKKNKGTYYTIFLKLNNGRGVMVAGTIHITTLINFLREFSKYYGDRLPEECRAHIQEFIKEKEHILKRFEEVAENV